MTTVRMQAATYLFVSHSVAMNDSVNVSCSCCDLF